MPIPFSITCFALIVRGTVRFAFLCNRQTDSGSHHGWAITDRLHHGRRIDWILRSNDTDFPFCTKLNRCFVVCHNDAEEVYGPEALALSVAQTTKRRVQLRVFDRQDESIIFQILGF